MWNGMLNKKYVSNGKINFIKNKKYTLNLKY